MISAMILRERRYTGASREYLFCPCDRNLKLFMEITHSHVYFRITKNEFSKYFHMYFPFLFVFLPTIPSLSSIMKRSITTGRLFFIFFGQLHLDNFSKF